MVQVALCIISYNVNGLRRCSIKRGAHHTQADLITGFLNALINELLVDSQRKTDDLSLVEASQEARSLSSPLPAPPPAPSWPQHVLVCLQETKLQRKTFFTDSTEYETFCVTAGHGHDVPAAGYSGVTTYFKRSGGLRVVERLDGCSWAVEAVREALDIGEAFNSSIGPLTDAELGEFVLPIAKTVLDQEGRCLTLRLSNNICVVNFYGVAASASEDRWLKKTYAQVVLECVCRACANRKWPLIITGDFNAVNRIRQDRAGCGDEEERETWIKFLLKNYDLADTWLELNPLAENIYTCWNQVTGARVTNYGSRIDMVIASKMLTLVNSHAHTHVLGSDHCPISATFLIDDAAADGESGGQEESVGVDHSSHRQLRLLDFIENAPSTPIKKAKLQSPTRPASTSPQPEAGSDSALIPDSVADRYQKYVRYLSRDQQKAYLESVGYAPRCSGHKLPCILRKVVNKKSVNLGRSFWVCCLPNGLGKDARCNFFAWHKSAG